MVETFLLGALSFAVTGIDDFLVLLSFNLLFPKQFKAILTGTLLGLIAVIVPSYYLSSFLTEIPLFRHLSTAVVASVVLGWLGYNLIKDFFSKETGEDEKTNINKSTKEIVLASGITYFLNGLDDFLIYSSFYLNSEKGVQNDTIFTIGVIAGLVLFGLITSILGYKALEYGKEKIKTIKLSMGIVMILVALVLVS